MLLRVGGGQACSWESCGRLLLGFGLFFSRLTSINSTFGSGEGARRVSVWPGAGEGEAAAL